MKKQDGFGLVLIIVAVVVIALIGGGAYLYLAKQGKAPSISSTPLAGLTLNPNCSYHDANLCKFINNFKAQTNYTMDASGVDASNKSDLKVIVAGDNKTQTIMTSNGKESYQTITIDNTTYTKDYTDNKWWKQTTSTSDTNYKSELAFKDLQATDSAQASQTTFKAQGKEACGSLTCYKYQVVDASSPDTTQSIWFDTNQYLLRKVEAKAADGQDSVIVYSYDKVNISAPADVKEMPTTPTGSLDINSPEVQQQLKALQNLSQQ